MSHDHNESPFLPWRFQIGQTVTYSYDVDHAKIEGYGFDYTSTITQQWIKDSFTNAFGQWERVANIHFQEVSGDVDADIDIYFDHMDGQFGTLGYNAFAEGSADGYVNNGDWMGIALDPSDVYSQYSVNQTTLHEIGHAIGLNHVDHWSVMNPFQHSAASYITDGDRAVVQTLYGPSTDRSFLVGSDGDDYLVDTHSHDLVKGFAGNDTVWGMGGNDLIYGNQGNDNLDGSFGNDTVYGGKDQDVVSGHYGDDVLYGNMGNDTLLSGGGSDTLYGGQGDDILFGNDDREQNGIDLLVGNKGNDVFVVGEGDIVIGGDGADVVHGDPTTFRWEDFNSGEGDQIHWNNQVITEWLFM